MTEHDHASAPITFAIITCSDTRGMKQDTAGAALEQLIADNGWVCKSHVVVKDEVPQISAAIVEACDTIDADENAEPRVPDEPLIASYMNYLVTNHGVIVPQYGDENDQLAVDTLQKIYDEVWGEGVYKCVGVQSEQVVFGGGNIHCITQQEPSA